MSKTTKPRRLKDTRPTSGKGSRQPVIKLPTLMPDGSKTTKHPLVWLMANRLPGDANKSTVAAALGVRSGAPVRGPGEPVIAFRSA